jgi:hypothetical protein
LSFFLAIDADLVCSISVSLLPLSLHAALGFHCGTGGSICSGGLCPLFCHQSNISASVLAIERLVFDTLNICGNIKVTTVTKTATTSKTRVLQIPSFVLGVKNRVMNVARRGVARHILFGTPVLPLHLKVPIRLDNVHISLHASVLCNDAFMNDIRLGSEGFFKSLSIVNGPTMVMDSAGHSKDTRRDKRES